MNLFEITPEYQVQINPAAYELLPFKTVWDRDKSKTKERARKELAYIVFKNDYKSPFVNEPDEKIREAEVLEHIFGRGTKWKADKVVEEAAEFYIDLQETFSLKLLRDTMSAVSRLREYFREINFTEVEVSEQGVVRPKYDVKKFVDTIEKIPKVIDSLQKIEESVKKEREVGDRLRGGREKGMYVD